MPLRTFAITLTAAFFVWYGGSPREICSAFAGCLGKCPKDALASRNPLHRYLQQNTECVEQ
eukprot:6205748-Pleurochrysis_carterae.AAC.6